MPFNVFSKLYHSMVWSTISYGAAIWRTQAFASINAVQNRTARFFLGVGKYAPNMGVNGGIGWTCPYAKQCRSVNRKVQEEPQAEVAANPDTRRKRKSDTD